MTRGQLPKAFLRVDPDIDQKHPDNLDGFIRLLCAANRQVPRGRFSSIAVVERLFGKVAVKRLRDRGDIKPESNGSITVPGWQTWQEGDWTVAERMRRYREGKGGISDQSPSPAVTAPVTNGVTDSVTPPSPASEASRRLGVKASRRSSSEPRARAGEARGNGRPPDDPYDQAVQWLAQRKAWVRDGSGTQIELAQLVDAKGAEAVIAAMEAVPGAERAEQFVFGARNAFYPLPGSKVAVTEEPDPEYVRQQLDARRRGRSNDA